MGARDEEGAALEKVTALFKTEKENGWDEWEVLEMDVQEEIGQPTYGQLVIAATSQNFDFSPMLGKSCVLILARGHDRKRYFKGLVFRIEHRGEYPFGSVARVDFATAVWAMRHGQDSQIFENRTAPQILEEVFKEALEPFGREVRLNLSHTYPVREYCTQYKESDWDFVQRLMADEGITFYLDEGGKEAGRETVVLVDSNDSFPEIETMGSEEHEEPLLQLPERAHSAKAARSTLAIQVVDELGKPVPQADVIIDSASVGSTRNDGRHDQGNVEAGSYVVSAARPGYRVNPTKVLVGPEQTALARVQLQRIRARLIWPKSGAAHQQFVNLDPDPSERSHGNRIAVRVGIVDGKAGDKLYLKIDWDAAKVSKRNSPARQVMGGTSEAWCPKGGKEVTLKADGEEPVVEIDLGLAGGDEITVAVGGTTDCADERCTIITWRKLWYEIMAPDFMGIGGDLGAGHRARVDALLLPCFVQYRVWKSHTFTEADAPAGTVFPGAYFGAPRKQFVLTDHTFTLYPTKNGKWDGGKKPRSVGLRLCDRNFFNDSGISLLWDDFTNKTGTFDVYTGLPGRFVLPRSAHDGTDTIKSITWMAQINAAAHAGHPAVIAGTPQSGNLATADVQFLDIKKFKVTLPNGTAAAPGPGRLVGPLGPATCPIRVTVQFEAADEGLGLSGQGAQKGENLVCYKASAPEGTADVMIHELCHSAGMAAIGGNIPPPGIPQPKKTSEADPDNQCALSTKGHLYSGCDHSGGHCARGLTDAQKTTYHYGGKPGTCINFGEGDLKDPSGKTDRICKTCAIILKGRELQSI
jgi:hypothetical protein